MENSDVIHKLADTTYRNVDELAGNLKKLVVVSRNLAKAMEDVVPLAEEFTSILDTVGSKASNLPGGVRNLGNCLKEMATANRKLNSSYVDWITSINTDLAVPLEDKLEREQGRVVRDWKGYRADASKKENVVEKSNTKLKGIRKKKHTRENMEKENQLCQVLEDQQSDLHSTRVEGLRKALIDQQRLYSFLIFHLCGVDHAQIHHCSQAYQTLSMKINDWSALSSNSEELPQESLVLLKNPHSPEAFKIPNDGGSDNDEEVDTSDDSASSPRRGLRVGQQGASFHGQHDLQRMHLNGQQQSNPVTTADIRKIQSETRPDIAQGRKRRTSCRVKAVHSFAAQESGRLNLRPGDLIDTNSGAETDGWLYGSNTQTKEAGWFPAKYVDKVWPTPEPVHRQVSTPTTLQPSSIPERDFIQRRAISPHSSPHSSRRNLPQLQPSPLTNRAPVLPQPSTGPPSSFSVSPGGPPTNNPPQKQLSFSDMIKARAPYVDSD